MTVTREQLQAAGVPAHICDGLVRYFDPDVGILPGGFLQAVLCYDLDEARRRADPSSLHAIHTLLAVLEDHAPMIAWGTRDKVLAWTSTPDRLEIPETRTDRLIKLLIHLIGHRSCTGYVVALTGGDVLTDGDVRTITCLRCGWTSFHPTDIAEKYCGRCHVFHEDTRT